MDADVIVIGAGAAGLAAACSLARRSLDVVVLEARERIGGRVCSQDIPGSAVPAELGAEFIHGPARETMDLLRKAGVEAIPTDGETWVCDESGILRLDESDFSAAARRAFEVVPPKGQDESVAQFLGRLARDEATRELAYRARAFVEGFEAADPEVASVRAIADELRSGVDAQSARPVGGYRPLIDLLAATCAATGVQTHLASVVRRVMWRPGCVTIDADLSDGRRFGSWSARAAILTLPIGVLHSGKGQTEVVFDPPLPTFKQTAIDSLTMGHAVRVTLCFRTPFWERVQGGRYRNAAFFRAGPADPFAAYWTQFPVRATLIVAWAGGPRAVALRGYSEAELARQALDGLGALLGEPELARAEFLGAVMHDWDRDPFARGAYSYVTVGGEGARAALASPLDETLFFAGEATSTDGQAGTVNGALATGERAADEVAAALQAAVRPT